MDDSLFEDFSFPFSFKPLLFAGKALEYHGLRAGNEYDLLLPHEEFHSLWQQFPDQRFLNPTGHRVIRIMPFEFYEHWFGYDYLLLAREAIDQGDYRVMPIMMLTFFTIIHITHEPENTLAKHDLVLLLQKLGVWSITSELGPSAPSSTDLHARDDAHPSEESEHEEPEQKEPHHD
jgi:hypothetical protein